MLRTIFPHPWLALTLFLVWLGLANTVTPGVVLLGVILAISLPVMTAAYWPDRPRLRRPLKIAEYLLLVMWDIIVANVQVAMIILFKRNEDIRSAWITVPLDVTSPEAITAFAGTITMTPGTVSTMLCADGSAILVHMLHVDDIDAARDGMKDRYERRLKEIFE
ncbi:MAG: Na+/H+ antiporter subunit E [Rhodobacteraceae bacterium]|jgi:multicomponent K+:H+ antiporter subunit E|nr:Na+/H+ antiporter subunit E [Paracoccaceae bacterium]